jgi:hypothetical protein
MCSKCGQFNNDKQNEVAPDNNTAGFFYGAITFSVAGTRLQLKRRTL